MRYRGLTGWRLALARIAIAACLPLAILLAISFARVAIADYGIHRQKQVLESDIAQLKEDNTRLGARLVYLNSDTGIELLAREELGWVRPGDTAVVLVRDQATGQDSTGRETIVQTPSPSH